MKPPPMTRIQDISYNKPDAANFISSAVSASTNFENISKGLLQKLRKLQQERISLHYELSKLHENGVEFFPYDHFWEQQLLDMNLKPSTSAISPLSALNIQQQ
jgi:hypothetical protein